MWLAIGVIIGLTLGVALTLAVYHRFVMSKASSVAGRARVLLAEAEQEAELKRRDTLAEAKDRATTLRQEAEDDAKKRGQDLERRSAHLERREHEFEQERAERSRELDRAREEIDARAEEIGKREAEAARMFGQSQTELERVAGMTAADARATLLRRIEEEAKRDAMALVREIETTAREEAEERARRIVTVAIQRLAGEQTADSTVTVVGLPSDDMKGRIIGREGRNIRAFEAVTGVNLIIDDTPEAVLISCFDPVRREVGRITLERLIGDGRIHPARIEEMYERAGEEVEAEVRRAGEDAVIKVGISDMHPELVRVLGRLRYRSSYGQNVLKHLIETAHLAGMIAAELGLSGEQVKIAKRGALLHDLGKAVTHEVEGSHALIGAQLAHRLGETAEVCHVIESHHGEVEQRTVEAVLAQTADHISGGRPGARRETLESYVKRLERLEEIASSYPGVDKTFAMQAGREVRIMVRPDDLDDVGCQVLARDVAKRIEEELQYPGQIKVTVVRETRSTEFAK